MSAQECIALIRSQAPDLTDDEIEDLVSTLQARLDARRARGELASVEEAMFDEADRLSSEVAQAAQIERRNRYLNILRRSELLETARLADETLGDPSLGLEGRMVGINSPLPGGRQSVDARGKAIFLQYAGGLVADLRRDGLLTTFTRANGLGRNRGIERAIAIELRELTLPDGKPGRSGISNARQIAQIIHKYRQVSVSRQNRAGAWINELPGYITRQTHDMMQMRRASARLGGPRSRDPEVNYRAWRDFIAPLLDGRTFDGVDEPEQFLRSAYDALVTGKHLRTEGADDNDLMFAFKGPGNLAKQISAHRRIHFKDADSWIAYNDRFGTRSLTESVLQELERGARNTALMEAFGPNPRAMFDEVRDRLMTTHRGDVQKFDRLKRRMLEYQFAEIDGTASIAANPTFASIGSGIRAVQALAKLGGAVLSAISDTAFVAAEVRAQGRRNTLAAYGQVVPNFLEALSPDIDKRRTAELMGVGIDGLLGDLATRWTAQDTTAGRIAKVQNVFFKLNLLGPWTDAHKRGLSMMMARDLALEPRSWDTVTPRTRRLLESYGFDAERWSIARAGVSELPDGRSYLTPENILNLPDSAFGQRTAREAQRLRDEIATDLRSYIADRADFAAPTPAARERAILRLGTQPGTAVGEAVRFVMQFKGFPVTAVTRVMGREVYGQGAQTLRRALLKGEGDLLGMAHTIAATTALGYLAQSAKEISRGREPRDPTDPGTWWAAALQGGGAGIYGDFLLGQTNRFGNSLLDTVAGPTLGTVADIDKIRAKIMAGEDVDADMLRLFQSNTPFVNLFYTRAALDHLVFYELQELVNPGYLRRMERRIEREQNQRYFLPPSRAVSRGGGGSFDFEGVR